MTYSELMKNKISSAKEGSAFIISDFTDIMDYETAKKTLARLEKVGLIRRVIRGVYDKPGYSSIIQEKSVPNPEEIAKAIARNYNWTIAPDENTALNLLGFSTQVPAKWQFISSGPYRNYEMGNTTISFFHRSCKEIQGMSYISALVIEAIKGIGRDNMTEDDIEYLRNKLSKENKQTILLESRKTPVWIYSIIKRICEEGDK